ncbi:unnamed protein product, partial [Allacma fusca]
MEGKHHSPHLKKVLKSYQLTAANTLSGPSSVLSRFNNTSDSTSSSSSSSNSSSPAGNISNVNIMERPYQASIMIKPEPGNLKSADESPGPGDGTCSGSLLHQQLKLKSLGTVSSPKAATTPFCPGPVKKEFPTREDSSPPSSIPSS